MACKNKGMKETLLTTPAADLQPTAANLAGATIALQEAHGQMLIALEAEAAAKLALDTARAAALVTGVEGKNEAARTAALDQLLADERQTLFRAEQHLREARTALAIAEARMTCLRYQVRLLEVGA